VSKFDLVMAPATILTLFGMVGGWFPRDMIAGVDIWFLFGCIPYLALRLPKVLMEDI